MMRLALFLSLIFAQVVNAATVEQNSAGSPKLNLHELIGLALKRSPLLKKSEAQVLEAESVTSQARGKLLPTISLNGGVAARDNPTTAGLSSGGPGSSEEYSAYLEAAQPIYSGGVLSGLAKSRQEEDLKRLAFVNDSQEVIATVAMAYYQVAENARLLSAAEQNRQTLKNYAGTIGRYEKIGRARKTDRLQALVNLAMAEAEVKQIAAQLYGAKETLRKLLALEEAPEVELPVDLIKIQYEKIKIDAAVEKAMGANPEVQSAKVSLEKVSNEKAVALSEDLPELKLTGQIGYKSPNEPDWLEDTSQYSQVALNLKVPLFSGLSSLAKRRQFEQKKVSATRDFEIKKLEVATDLHSKITELESTIERLDLAQQANQDASSALSLANRDYQQGLISNQDLVNIQRTRYEAEKLYVTTQFVYFKTLLETRRLMGVQLEKVYAAK